MQELTRGVLIAIGLLSLAAGKGVHSQAAPSIRFDSDADARKLRATIADVKRFEPPRLVAGNTEVKIPTGVPVSFFMIHFRSVSLGSGSRLVVREANGNVVWSLNGPAEAPESTPALPPGSLTVRCEGASCSAEVESYSRGFLTQSLRDQNFEIPISLQQCGACELSDVPCYGTSYQQMSRAVIRITIDKTDSCTGFLVGDKGHVITNSHCIANAQEARASVFEAGVAETSCKGNCPPFKRGSSPRSQTGAILVDVDRGLDVAIVQVNKSFADVFGYLKLRSKGPNLGESIYVPQHPLGQTRKIAQHRIYEKDLPSCLRQVSVGSVGYDADTLQGSSGSPVVAATDNLVVAVHNCPGCPNRGISSSLVAARFRDSLPNSAFVD